MANLVRDNPNLIAPLFEIAFDVDTPISSRACWVLEFTAKERLDFLLPYLNRFTKQLRTVHLDSSVRPMAKICEYLITAYYSKKENNVQAMLTPMHLERISTACFDWMISNQKVAAQAYSMTCLYLKLLLEQNYSSGSAAYKARARMILRKLNEVQ